VVLLESSEGFNMKLCFEGEDQVLGLDACRLLICRYEKALRKCFIDFTANFIPKHASNEFSSR
jgi:hypothetical protein